MLRFIQKYWKGAIPFLLIILVYNLYFIFLMKEKDIRFLLYLDGLIAVVLAGYAGVQYIRFAKWEQTKKQFLEHEDVIYHNLPDFENCEIVQHDVWILETKLNRQFEENCELQDDIARWCHEWKIPLATCLLIDETIKDVKIRASLREPLERMNHQVNMMMQGCRLQSPLMDLQVERVSVEACVKTSIKNNQFFLIQKRFTLDIQEVDCVVYTDFAWLVYILDQLLNNAVKYANKEEPRLKIWTEKEEEKIRLYIEDNGEGISDSDIRRIFEKGFTGHNYHNGKYKSTGMGLYLAAKVAKKLEIELLAESVYEVYTRFCIVMRAADL